MSKPIVTPQKLIDKKRAGQKISMLTAFDVQMARHIDDAGIDAILIGDSLANTFAGHDTTLPVTMEQIIYHTEAVKRGVSKSLIISDMPFMSYHVSHEEAKFNAGRLLKEAGAGAVKMEVGPSLVDTVKAVVDIGIPVMAHIGFTPQFLYQLGGYRVQGKTEESQAKLLELADSLAKAGCFGIVLEMVPAKLAEQMTKALPIPTIGIGAGAGCDGQVLVTSDLLGVSDGFSPKFAKRYARLHEPIKKALSEFKSEVESGVFPDQSHAF